MQSTVYTSPIAKPAQPWRTFRRQYRRLGQAIAFTLCALLAVLYIFPFYWMIVTALKTDQQVFVWPPALWPATPQWQNFVEATRYIPFWLYMRNTLVICLITVVGTLISCTLIAYGFSRLRWPGRDAIFIIYLSTIMLPGQVTMIPLYVVFRNLGWVGTILPLVVPAFFGNAFFVFLLRQFFRTIPSELTDAARIDGANEFGILWHIMLPLTRPALFTVALFSFLNAYRDFLGPLVYLTEQSQWTISLGLQLFKNMYGAQWQLMMAASTLMMLPVIALFFVTQRTFVEGIATTGLNG